MDMKAELESVLASPVFARSPVQARLLTYLVEASLEGHGKDLKSYSVAVEGLGKSADFDSQADSYPRVQVGRVRKSLDNFYSCEGASRSHRLSIEAGSYEVRLVPNEPGNSPDRSGSPGRITLSGGRTAEILAFGALLAIAMGGGAFFATNRPTDPAVWETDDFPTVEVSVRADEESPEAQEVADIIRDLVVVGLNNFENLAVSYKEDPNADYKIEILVSLNPEIDVDTFVEDRRRGRLIWSDEVFYRRDDPDLRTDIERTYSKFPSLVGHATGLIHSNERKYVEGHMTPYGCWLLFSSVTYKQGVGSEASLGQCAEDWYQETPNHPIAAGLHGWGLIDKSLGKMTESGRQEMLGEAIRILQNARAMHPNSVLLQVTTMRAFANAGERGAVIDLAERAIAEHPDNLDVVGYSGMMLTLQNDPRGENIIKDACARHFNPPPWYFVGLFVAAMMRDDDRGVRQALENLGDLNLALPIRPLLAAAAEAHSGQLEKARVSWAEAEARQPVLKVNADLFFTRLPMAPEVRDRLKEWLEPVL